MKHPLFKKLKADTGVVWNELFIAVTCRPAPKVWRHPRDNPPAPEMAVLKPVSPSQSGLVCFNLN